MEEEKEGVREGMRERDKERERDRQSKRMRGIWKVREKEKGNRDKQMRGGIQETRQTPLPTRRKVLTLKLYLDTFSRWSEPDLQRA